MHDSLHPELTFAEAADVWLNSRTMSPGSRARYISPRTLMDLLQYIRALNRKFGTVPLNNIDIGLLREYQRERAETCGANKINQEVGTLVRIMKRAGVWSQQLEQCYERLQPEQADVARAMTPEEQKMFLGAVSSRAEWQLVYWYSLLALATSASNCEMRGIRLGDINLYSKTLHIRREHAKNRYRIRTIPMHDEAVWAVTRLIERARSLGAVSPHHHLMPFRVSPIRWDLDRPMSNSGIRKAWEAVRQAAGVPWLRIHDLRHTAITRMAEAGVPIPVILSMAGHISTRMQQHYTSVSDFAKRRAVEAAFGAGNYMVSGGRLLGDDPRPRCTAPRRRKVEAQHAASCEEASRPKPAGCCD